MGEIESSLIEKVNKDFEGKINNVAASLKLLTNKLTPINDLIALANKHYGMMMPDVINEYVLERLLLPKLSEFRHEMVSK